MWAHMCLPFELVVASLVCILRKFVDESRFACNKYAIGTRSAEGTLALPAAKTEVSHMKRMEELPRTLSIFLQGDPLNCRIIRPPSTISSVVLTILGKIITMHISICDTYLPDSKVPVISSY